MRSDTHDRDEREEAIEEVMDVLDDVFGYGRPTDVYGDRSGTSYYLRFTDGGIDYHFEVDFWSGNIFFEREVDGEWETLVEHT